MKKGKINNISLDVRRRSSKNKSEFALIKKGIFVRSLPQLVLAAYEELLRHTGASRRV